MSCGTQGTGSLSPVFAYRAITLYRRPFHGRSANLRLLNAGPTTPFQFLKMVWAPPPSLAATDGISVLISIPPGTKMFQFPGFTLLGLCIRTRVTGKPVGLPHSDTNGSKLAWQLPVAFRSHPRPSSSLSAKASPVCPYLLVLTFSCCPNLRARKLGSEKFITSQALQTAMLLLQFSTA